MAANETTSTGAAAATDVGIPTKTFRCEVCARPVLVATARIAPTIPAAGWRCARPACSPERDSAPVHQAGAPVNTITITSSTADPTCWKGDARGPE